MIFLKTFFVLFCLMILNGFWKFSIFENNENFLLNNYNFKFFFFSIFFCSSIFDFQLISSLSSQKKNPSELLISSSTLPIIIIIMNEYKLFLLISFFLTPIHTIRWLLLKWNCTKKLQRITKKKKKKIWIFFSLHAQKYTEN